jgi:hypothetical protein
MSYQFKEMESFERPMSILNEKKGLNIQKKFTPKEVNKGRKIFGKD